MHITNRDKVIHNILYRIAGVAARVDINPAASVDIGAITSIDEIVFKSWERKVRQINNTFNGHPSIEQDNGTRFTDTKIDYRLVFSGATI